MRRPIDLVTLAREAMRERGLEPDFPPDAAAQAERLRAPAPGAGAEDLRQLPWCSIDNDDSRDLDQLTVADRNGDGEVRVLVAIADVDALVPRDTPLDLHAQRNTTSVYTPARVFPMLPERLSTDLTSLNPDRDRMAVVVGFTVGADGRPREAGLWQALVRNHAKLAYDSVAEWLDGSGHPPPALADTNGVAAQVRMQDEIAQRLRSERHAEGALDLEGIETRAVVSDGKVTELRTEGKNRARSMIEDFMIAVNGVTARYLERKGLPSVRRVVREPRRWDRLQALAAEHGDRLPDAPDPHALSDFLARRRRADALRYPDLSLAVVKLLGRGEYVLTRSAADRAGHFGLAMTEYVHSTAPNRRYPDLITQRLLKAAIAGAPTPYSDATLDQLARHCTLQEDAADKVERQMRKSAAALLLSTRIGERFAAIVTGASRKGIWVRTLRPPVEGKLIGGEGVDVGERVTVKLVGTDVERGFIDFEPAR